jgi:formate hydrogenlyase subunit 3/multisubunit Na+/H+ antiporter MnhD subunit
LLICGIVSTKIFLRFLTIYSVTLTITLNFLRHIKTKRTTGSTEFWATLLVIRNIGGLPPLAIFWAKILLLKTLLNQNIPREVCLLLMISACYILYHYLWISTNENIKTPKKTQIKFKRKRSPLIITRVLAIIASTTILWLGLTLCGIYLDRVKLKWPMRKSVKHIDLWSQRLTLKAKDISQGLLILFFPKGVSLTPPPTGLRPTTICIYVYIHIYINVYKWIKTKPERFF